MKDLVKILTDRFAEIKKKSPSFSQRAFAKKLGVSSGTLSEIFAKKRVITPKLAEKIAQKLEFTPFERKAAGLPAPSDAIRSFKNVPVNKDTIAMIEGWWHFAILSLTNVPTSQSSSAWIAKHLGISKAEAEEALERLQRLGLIVKEGNRWQRTSKRIIVDNIEAARAIEGNFDHDAEMIKKSFQLPTDVRCNASATFALDSNQIHKLRLMVHRFLQDEFLTEAESKNADQIYRIVVHFYPITK